MAYLSEAVKQPRNRVKCAKINPPSYSVIRKGSGSNFSSVRVGRGAWERG